jgi:hypothetical protein
MSDTTILIEPMALSTRVRVWQRSASKRPVMRAELPAEPAHPRAVQWLIEALALWQGEPVHAVLAADTSSTTYVTRLYPAWFTDFGNALYTLEFRDGGYRHAHRPDRTANVPRASR